MERDSFRNVRRAGNLRVGKDFDLFTRFVDNIPVARNQSWLESLFSNYGIVRDLFILAKRSKRGSKFGFVHYDCSVSAAVAISRANGLEVEGNYLFVKKASFDLENKRRSDVVDSSKSIEDSRQEKMELKVEVAKHLKNYGDGNRPIEEEQIQDSTKSSNVAQNKRKVGNQDILKNGVEEGNISTEGPASVIP
ncbi:hypothetical protein Vadar_012666 [Vaccinium darrowii]|uniref:Uncharacterized protein n=1 Tax=Vaccinium darrowii TaxID=229202 RepID=A0ACB7Y036_9ERIC|nr:hypothetical protein Vadar_012666 [Vaccinium darrowii]